MCIMSQLRTVFFFVGYLRYLNRSHSACECSRPIGSTTQVTWAHAGGPRCHGPSLWLCNKVLKPNFQSIISQTNNGCSLLSLILAKLLLSDINSENVFALSIVTAWGGEGVGGYNPLPIEPQMTSYIIETVRTKCIIGKVLKIRGQKYDKLSLKIVQKALKWLLQHANIQKFSGGACPRTPLESFLALKLLKNNSAGKNTLEKSDEN